MSNELPWGYPVSKSPGPQHVEQQFGFFPNQEPKPAWGTGTFGFLPELGRLGTQFDPIPVSVLADKASKAVIPLDVPEGGI